MIKEQKSRDEESFLFCLRGERQVFNRWRKRGGHKIFRLKNQLRCQSKLPNFEFFTQIINEPSLVNRECLYEKRRSFCKVIIFLKMIQLLTLFTLQILHLRHFFQCFCGEYVVLPGAFTSRSFLIKKGEVGKQCI